MTTSFGRWNIRQVPDPVLYRKAEEITVIRGVSDEIRRMAQYMAGFVGNTHRGPTGQSMKYVGIAAPQIGESVRLICVLWGNEVLALVNPVITKQSSLSFNSLEGCLSVPGIFRVVRPSSVKVNAFNIDRGRNITLKGRDFESAMLCHEIDHLDGITLNRKVGAV